MKPGPQRNWLRYARADLHLSGHSLKEIGGELDVCVERARQIVYEAKRQLAFRVFKDVPRPLPPPSDLRSRYRYKNPPQTEPRGEA